MRTKIIASVAAGGLLVGAGLVTSIVSSASTAVAQEESATVEEHGFFPRGLAFLGEVLDELVADQTIDQADADAVLDAVTEKAEAIRAERESLRELTQSLLEDGVITEAEASQLPDDHPLLGDAFDDAWEDGELTTEEIRRARPHPHRDAFRRGAHFGALLDDGGIDPDEFQSLPDDHPLTQIDLTEYWDDELITRAELREIWGQLKAESGA